MLVSVASFSVMDAQLKLLSEHYPALQVAFIRGAAALPFVLLPILLRNRLARLRPVNIRLHFARGALAVLMLYSFVQAVRETSLASTYSIFMFAPLLVAALSAPLLRERVARVAVGGDRRRLPGRAGHAAAGNGRSWCRSGRAVGVRRRRHLCVRGRHAAAAGAHRLQRKHGLLVHGDARGRSPACCPCRTGATCSGPTCR